MVTTDPRTTLPLISPIRNPSTSIRRIPTVIWPENMQSFAQKSTISPSPITKFRKISKNCPNLNPAATKYGRSNTQSTSSTPIKKPHSKTNCPRATSRSIKSSRMGILLDFLRGKFTKITSLTSTKPSSSTPMAATSSATEITQEHIPTNQPTSGMKGNGSTNVPMEKEGSSPTRGFTLDFSMKGRNKVSENLSGSMGHLIMANFRKDPSKATVSM